MPNGREQSKRPTHGHSSKHQEVERHIQGRHNSARSTGDAGTSTPSLEPRRSHSRDEDSFLKPVCTLTTSKDQQLVYYPAFCHKASPTWFEWVRLTVCDIHTKLHIKPEYQHSWLTEHRYSRDAPQLTFYKNHPIQFVQVIGIVVSFDEYFDRFWLFTIDDSSGYTIDIVCPKPAKDKDKVKEKEIQKNVFAPEKTNDALPALRQDPTDDGLTEEAKEALKISELVSTTVRIGAVLQVKGVITLFRRYNSSSRPANDLTAFNNTKQQSPNSLERKSDAGEAEAPIRQILLQRLTVIHTTTDELRLIASRTEFHENVLSKPWVLNRSQQDKLRKEASGEIEHRKKRAKRHDERLKKAANEQKLHEEVVNNEYARDEEQRKQDAEMARQAGLKLKMDLEKKKDGNMDEIVPLGDPESKHSAALVRSECQESTAVNSSVNGGKSKRAHKRKHAATATAKTGPVNTRQMHQDEKDIDDTNDSFAALEDEKSALLKAAFG